MRNCLSRAVAFASFVVVILIIQKRDAETAGAVLRHEGRAFEAAGWEVISLDIVSKFEPTILCDVRSWDYGAPAGALRHGLGQPGLHGIQPSADEAPPAAPGGRRSAQRA